MFIVEYLGVCESSIKLQTKRLPISFVAKTPVGNIRALPFTVSSPTAPVAAPSVISRKLLLTILSSPRPLVDVTADTPTIATACTATVPIAVVFVKFYSLNLRFLQWICNY